MSLAQVAIAAPLRQTFSYEIPAGMDIRVGSRVFVPFGRRVVVGYVIGVGQSLVACRSSLVKPATSYQQPATKEMHIKDIIDSPDVTPVFTEKMVELVRWISDYYCSPIGEVCKAALPALLTKHARKKKREVTLKETAIDDVFMSAPEVALTQSQRSALDGLLPDVSETKFRTTLLHGITGSGKTEIYLRLFAEVIKRGRQGIFLVPEIGMTPQTVGRVIARFGDQVAVYHSSLTDARRLREWKRMQDGSAKIVIGTRSAVFAPFKDLGLIVLDEEHDPSYKQDENPRYNGRDTAVMRAKLEGVPCVLGSATPSFESYTNSQNKKYHYIHLPDRPSGIALPDVEVVDMREVPKGANLSPLLINAISETLQRKEQTILFLNRRGFASFVLCESCGETFLCPNCNITLTYHRNDKNLACHYCEYKMPVPKRCNKCRSGDIKALGTGTEKIEAEIRGFFPDASIARLDRDSVEKSGERPKILKDMKSGDTDILIGTQMITKGHDFPNVTLVGVIDADMSLNFPDFRAPERTFQLITQVAGRSGRRDSRGRVVVQTYTPEHYAITSSREHDFIGFFKEELPHRRELSYPPFGRLALVRVQGMNDSLVEKVAGDIADRLSQVKGRGSQITILGPSTAPISRVRGRSRWHILIKSSDINNLRPALSLVMSYEKEAPRGIKVIVDVDPINML